MSHHPDTPALHVHLPARRPCHHRRAAGHGDPDAEVGRRRPEHGRQPVGADVGARRGRLPDARDRGAGDGVRADVASCSRCCAATRSGPATIDTSLAATPPAQTAPGPATGEPPRRRRGNPSVAARARRQQRRSARAISEPSADYLPRRTLGACRRPCLDARRILPWRGISSSPAAWSPRSAKVSWRRASRRCSRRAAIGCASASSIPI